MQLFPGERYYKLLLSLNERIEDITSCSERTHPKLWRNPFVPYFYGSTPPDLEINDKGQFILVSYKIVFTPAYLPGKPELPLWKERIEEHYKDEFYEDLIMRKYKYYDAFVGQHLPSTMEVENCHGDRCRHDMHAYYSGIWCESCHGEFEDDVDLNLRSFINNSVYLKDFPKQCIVRMDKETKPVSSSFALEDHLNRLKRKVALTEQIKKRLENWEEETSELQKQFLSRREQEKQVLLASQGKDYSQTLKKITGFLERKKREKEVEERKQKIKALEEDNNKKRQELEKQLQELEEERKCLSQVNN